MSDNIGKDEDSNEKKIQDSDKKAKDTDSILICMEDVGEKSTINNDFSHINDTVLDVPFPRAENVTNALQRSHKKNLFGFFKSDTDENPPTVWVQSIWQKSIQSEGPPLEYDPYTRNYFVRKVFFILTIMLLGTFLFVILLNIPPIQDVFKEFWLFFLLPAVVIMLGVSYAFMCSQCSRKPPCNYFCILLAVLSMSVICAFVTMRYDTKIIVYAVLATCVAVFACSVLALTSFDFTAWYLYVVLISLALFALSLIMTVAKFAFGFYMKPLHIALLFGVLIVHCVFLIMELQMVLGGRTIELGEEDYALGAYMLYMSIIEIFLTLVRIFGMLDN